MHRAKILVCGLFALCFLANAQNCADVVASGCGGDGPLLGQFVPAVPGFALNCRGVFEVSTVDGCDRAPGGFVLNDCETFPSVFPTPIQAGICADWFNGCCSTLPTIAPTLAPSTTPTAAPSQSPTPPTPSPSNAPSSTPTAAPSNAPSPLPTAAPVTPEPTSKELGFFDVEENIYIVAGAGGGGLLLAAAAIALIVRRNRSGSDMSAVSSTSGGGGGNVAPEDIFDWEKHIDKKSGEVYFFNPKTGESRWDPPPVKTM